MLWTESETSDSQSESSKKRRRSSAGLSRDYNKRKKVSPTNNNHSTGMSNTRQIRKNMPASDATGRGTKQKKKQEDMASLNIVANENEMGPGGGGPELREVIVNLMGTLKDVYGEEVLSSLNEETSQHYAEGDRAGPSRPSCSLSSCHGDLMTEESLLSEIIEKAQHITEGLMQNLHSNVSNNNKIPRHVKYMQPMDPEIQSDSTISSVSLDYALQTNNSQYPHNVVMPANNHQAYPIIEVPVNRGSVDIEPSSSYMDLNNNMATNGTGGVPLNEEGFCLSRSSASAEVIQQISDLDINQTGKLGFFKELLSFLKEDGGCSELSSDDLSYLSSLMSQREERGQESEAHTHRQAEGPQITGRQQGQGEKDLAKVTENISIHSSPVQSGLPKLSGTGKLFPHKSSLSMLTPRQKPSIPPPHQGNFILAGKPADDRGSSYWRQFRSPEPLMDRPKTRDDEKSFAREYINNTLPQLIRSNHQVNKDNTNWQKQISKDSLVKNKIYEYYYKLRPGTMRPCEMPTLKIKDINFGEKSQKKEHWGDATTNHHQVKLDTKSMASTDQSSTSLSCLQRQDPCPSLASGVLHKSSHTPPTSSFSGDSSLKRANRKIETAKEAVLNSLYKSNSVVQMNKHRFWRQSNPLGSSVYSTIENQGEERGCSVYQLGSLKNPLASSMEERGADSRLSGPLMGKILEGYDQSCGSRSESECKQRPDSKQRGNNNTLLPMSLSDAFRNDLAKKYGKDSVQKIGASHDGNNSGRNRSSSSSTMGGIMGKNARDLKSIDRLGSSVHDRLSIGSSFLKEDNNKLRRDYALSKQRQIEERRRKQELLKLRFGKDKHLDQKLYRPVYKLSDRDPYAEQSSFDYRRASRAEVKNIDSRAVSPKAEETWTPPRSPIKDKVSSHEKVPEIKVKVRHIKKKSINTDQSERRYKDRSAGKEKSMIQQERHENKQELPRSLNKQRENKAEASSQKSAAYQNDKQEERRIGSEAQLNRNSNNQYSFLPGTQNGLVQSDNTLNTTQQRGSQTCINNHPQQPYYQSETYLQRSARLSDSSGNRKYLPTAAEILYFADRSHRSFHQYNISRQASDACHQNQPCNSSACDAIASFWDVTNKLRGKEETDGARAEEPAANLVQQQYDLVGQVLQDSKKQVTFENHRNKTDAKKKTLSSAKSKTDPVKPVDVKVPQWKNEKFYKEWMLQKELAKLNKFSIITGSSKGIASEDDKGKTDPQCKSFTDSKLYTKSYDANKYSPDNSSTTNLNQEEKQQQQGLLQPDSSPRSSIPSSNKNECRKVFPKDYYVNPSGESRAHVSETLRKMLVQKVYEEHTGEEYPTGLSTRCPEKQPETEDIKCNKRDKDEIQNEGETSATEPERQGEEGIKKEKSVCLLDSGVCYKPGLTECVDRPKEGVSSTQNLQSNSQNPNKGGLKPILKNRFIVKINKSEVIKQEIEKRKLKKEKDIKVEEAEGSEAGSDFTIGDATRLTTSPVENGSATKSRRNLPGSKSPNEITAYKSYGDSSDKNKSDYYHNNSRSSKVNKERDSKYSSFTPRVKTAEKKSQDKQKKREIIKEDDILKKESMLRRESDLQRVGQNESAKKNELHSDDNKMADKIEETKMDSKFSSKILEDLDVDNFCQLSDISSQISDSDWSMNSNRSFITQMFDDEDEDSDDEDLLKPAFDYENPPTKINNEKEDKKVTEGNTRERVIDREIHYEARAKISEDSSKKKEGSPERIKSTHSKHHHKSHKPNKKSSEGKLKKKRSSSKKLDNSVASPNTRKSTIGQEKEKRNLSTVEKESQDHIEQTGVESFKDYLQKKARSKNNLSPNYSTGAAGNIENGADNIGSDINIKRSPQDVFKSVWVRTRGNEAPYVVNPWKPKREGASRSQKKVFDRQAYSYLLDPSMGDCSTTEDALIDLWDDLPDDRGGQQLNSEGQLVEYDGQCIVSVSSPGHDDVHITITLPVARKQNQQSSSGRKQTSSGSRKNRTKKKNLEKAGRRLSQESEEVSSTENSDDALVRKMDYPQEVRKCQSVIKERSNQVTEHNSYQNFTTGEKQTSQVTDTNTRHHYSSGESSGGESQQADLPRGLRSTSSSKKHTDNEARSMEALAKEQAKIYSIIKSTTKPHSLYLTERRGQGCSSVRRLEPEGCTSSEEESTADTSSYRCLSDSSTGATMDSKESRRAAMRDLSEESIASDRNSHISVDNPQNWGNTHGENSGAKYIDDVEYSIRHYQTQRCYDKVTLESQCGYINLQSLKTWLPYVEDNGFLYIPVREITGLFKECVGRCNIRKSTLLKDGELDVRMCSHHQANLFGNIWPIGKQSTNIHSGDMMVRWDRFSQHYRRLRKRVIEQHRNTTKKWSRQCLSQLKQ